MALVGGVLSSTTRGQPYVQPIGRAVAVSLESLDIHQCFNQPGTYAVRLFPIVAECTHGQGQNMTGQIGDSYPGEDQETAVTDQVLEVGLASIVVPADPGISGFHAPCG